MDAGTSSKARPDALGRFLGRDEAHSTHAQLNQSNQASASGSFRQAGQPSSSSSSADFDAFLHSSASPSESGPPGAPLAGSSSSAFSGRRFVPQQPQDGTDIQALLSSNGVTDAVSGDWASELASSQAQPWRVQSERSLPHDPLTSSSAKGKGREQFSTPGDVSPITSELINSLATLNVADQTYLRTLLARSPDQAITDYFSRGSYTDDVWGEPSSAVDAIMEKVKQGAQEGEGQASTREKAVRRLAMVARHLGGASVLSTAQSTGLASSSVHQQREAEAAQLSRGSSWVDEYPILAQHAPFADYLQPEAPVHPAQHSSPYLQRHLAQHRPMMKQAPRVSREQEKDQKEEEESLEQPPLGPFHQYFENKLRQMSGLQGSWRRPILTA